MRVKILVTGGIVCLDILNGAGRKYTQMSNSRWAVENEETRTLQIISKINIWGFSWFNTFWR